MLISMDDIAAISGAEDIKKKYQKLQKNRLEKKMEYIWINKNKHSSDKNRKRYITEKIEEEVRAGEK